MPVGVRSLRSQSKSRTSCAQRCRTASDPTPQVACPLTRRHLLVPRPLVSGEGQQAGLPKLRINTLKKGRQPGSPAPDTSAADFYSPPSSFHNSPLSGSDPSSLLVASPLLAETAAPPDASMLLKAKHLNDLHETLFL